MIISTNISLKHYNTFGIDASAKYFTSVQSIENIRELLESNEYKSNQRLILGGGSNLLLTKNVDALVIKNDLGFGKTGSLVLLSGKRQNYIKEISLQKVDNNSAYFLIELKPNYLTTLKENGLTSFVFCENIEFVIPKTNSESVKKAASCFMETAIKK